MANNTGGMGGEMSPFLFSKYEGKKVRRNKHIIPLDQPKDYTHYLAGLVIVCTSAALLLLWYNNKRDIAQAEYIRLCHKTCAVECHYQRKPIIPDLATYRRIKQGHTIAKDKPVLDALNEQKEHDRLTRLLVRP